jgi:hypothetical protein
MQLRGAADDKNGNSAFGGLQGDVSVVMTQRHPPRPSGCCPLQGGIFKGDA